ncbi:MAG TPA: hypothetical protein VJU61_07350 [Polyangiaceae bacterium]|nr:hypothetical protein [Polyangiaceae bacterium]
MLTLRGILDGGPLFWRGDATNETNSFDASGNFSMNFNVVFPALLGNDGFLDEASFRFLTLWSTSISPPPNPNRALDNSLTFNQAVGSDLFTNRRTDGLGACIVCHKLDPSQGQFGTGGEMTLEGETQEFKVVQLRTTYDKVGMFGVVGDAPIGGVRPQQIRGFGTLHDGSLAGPESFIRRAFPNTLNPDEAGLVGDAVLVFPTQFAPIVGQQITLRAENAAGDAVNARIDLLRSRALTPYALRGANDTRECDLVVKGVVDGVDKGFLMLQDGTYMDERGGVVADDALRSMARRAPLTFTCTTPGSGRRTAFDRDGNGMSDALEP